ncbi:hypothetical protein I6F35_18550 [Bradyrhizobium sp. BRP22]|uniref:hypothetical protein n=1 Tax=Bradyrhizobium sp. BRP22 TaxID=2793821 RepID=UPI001CD487F7|nr:hypothetical protein [Bradyrhizobium sp. BRP22]MCA1455195.1 hypothetical protein [Bradyrhizobium sp. BRP22]
MEYGFGSTASQDPANNVFIPLDVPQTVVTFRGLGVRRSDRTAAEAIVIGDLLRTAQLDILTAIEGLAPRLHADPLSARQPIPVDAGPHTG